MNTKFATALVIAAAALGAGSSSFAFGTSNDNGVWSGNGAQTAVALNPNGDNPTQPAFHSVESRTQVSNGAAQNRAVLSAVATNPQGPTLVAQPTFRPEQTRAAVRQEVAQNRQVLVAVTTNPNGDDALPLSVAESRVNHPQQQRAALTFGRAVQGNAE